MEGGREEEMVRVYNFPEQQQRYLLSLLPSLPPSFPPSLSTGLEPRSVFGLQPVQGGKSLVLFGGEVDPSSAGHMVGREGRRERGREGGREGRCGFVFFVSLIRFSFGINRALVVSRGTPSSSPSPTRRKGSLPPSLPPLPPSVPPLGGGMVIV